LDPTLQRAVTAMALSLMLLSLLGTLASAQYCPTLHVDFLRRQAANFRSPTPFNETSGAKHTPYISINGTKGTVKVGNGQPYHPMTASSDPNTVHFITTIYVLDQSGGFVAMDVLDPTGVNMAQMEFDIPSSATELVAYEWCNLHGLWKGPEVSVVSPGPSVATCTKPQVGTTAQTSFIADLHRRQAAAPFNSPTPFNETLGSKHTPYIALQGTNGTVTVGNGSPFHPMVASTDPATVHFITLIYVLDQAGHVVVMKNLDPTGVDKAAITFSVPTGATSLTAYEWCNKHGLWKGPTVTVPASSSSTTTRRTTTTTPLEISSAVPLASLLSVALCSVVTVLNLD
jgi:desulfoferrodoxin (superoxide reductase-like protein)